MYQEAGYSQSPTRSRPAECGSRQAIQARPDNSEWSLLPEVFQSICCRWHQPQIDLFATRFNNKLPQFMSPISGPLAWAVDALSLPWEDLDAYAFPPAAILGKVVEKLQDHPSHRIILSGPGWSNLPWFWDLVVMSSQAKWTIFTKWYFTNQVDLRAPPIKYDLPSGECIVLGRPSRRKHMAFSLILRADLHQPDSQLSMGLGIIFTLLKIYLLNLQCCVKYQQDLSSSVHPLGGALYFLPV